MKDHLSLYKLSCNSLHDIKDHVEQAKLHYKKLHKLVEHYVAIRNQAGTMMLMSFNDIRKGLASTGVGLT